MNIIKNTLKLVYNIIRNFVFWIQIKEPKGIVSYEMKYGLWFEIKYWYNLKNKYK